MIQNVVDSLSFIVLLLLLLTLGGVRSYFGENMIDTIFGREKKAAVYKPMVLSRTHMPCDWKEIRQQLERMYVISPERIVQLLNTEELNTTCADIEEILEKIKNYLASCQHSKSSNSYKRLVAGVTFFDAKICKPTNKDDKTVINHHSCLKEMRDDFLDCEGPAYWFEKTNETYVCPLYNDIINCHYIKVALLCGLEPAQALRSFLDGIMQIVLEVKCKIKRTLPHVADPMPSRGHDCNKIVTRNTWSLLYNKAIYYIPFLIVDSLLI